MFFEKKINENERVQLHCVLIKLNKLDFKATLGHIKS